MEERLHAPHELERAGLTLIEREREDGSHRADDRERDTRERDLCGALVAALQQRVGRAAEHEEQERLTDGGELAREGIGSERRNACEAEQRAIDDAPQRQGP